MINPNIQHSPSIAFLNQINSDKVNCNKINDSVGVLTSNIKNNAWLDFSDLFPCQNNLFCYSEQVMLFYFPILGHMVVPHNMQNVLCQ